MGDPLPADHELVFHAFAKTVARATMKAGDADAVFNRRRQVLDFFLLDL